MPELTTEQVATMEIVYDSAFTENPALTSLVEQYGTEVLLDQLRKIAGERKATAAATALSSACAMTVSNWTAVDTHRAGARSTAINELRSQIHAKLVAHDATGLGPLLLAHFASEWALRGS